VTFPYDVTARVVECSNCGAPLTLHTAASVKCDFCGVLIRVGPRPHDGRPPLTPAQEIARLAQLKAQQSHAIPGHIFDLSGLPPALMFAGATADARLDLVVLHRLWGHARAKADEGLEAQRALCWVAIHAARLLSVAGEYAGARARLETALNQLTDPGHRLLVRAELCLEAIKSGELAAARGWLAECDPAPEILELDSALRYASARICLAENDSARALGLVGAAAGALPVDPHMEACFVLVRIHAHELNRRFAKAKTLWSRFVQKSDEVALISTAQLHGLAPQTRRDPMTRHAHALAKDIANAGRLSFLLSFALTLAPLLTLALAFIVSIEGCATQRGPLLGATAVPVCSALCESCQAPATYYYWRSNQSGHHAVLCDSEALRPSQMDGVELSQFSSVFPHLEVPGGAAAMFAASYVMLFPLGLAAGLPFAHSRRKRLRAQLHANKKRLAGFETELAAAGAPVGTPAQRWTSPLVVALLALLFMSVGTGSLMKACSAEPPNLAQP
jgi:hypothetical protein